MKLFAGSCKDSCRYVWRLKVVWLSVRPPPQYIQNLPEQTETVLEGSVYIGGCAWHRHTARYYDYKS